MQTLRAGDPEEVGGYRLLGRLGSGGMGRVYLAQSPRGRTVAVKLVRPELAELAEFRIRFEQEVRAARQVGGEWTAPVLDADTSAEQPWVATGYIPGLSLSEVLNSRREALPERTIRVLGNRLTLALRAIHGAGLIHRDLKPSNILVTIDGPRVIDFGIARAMETLPGRLTRTGAVIGSPAFMSPEQVRGQSLTAASDVFCLGSLLAFAAGGAPFGGEDTSGHGVMYRIAQEAPELTVLPERLRELVAACLAKVPGERPSLSELLERTAGSETDAGEGGAREDEPWLPGDLVARLGRHAASLLDAEVPQAAPVVTRSSAALPVPPPSARTGDEPQSVLRLGDGPEGGVTPPSEMPPSVTPSSVPPPSEEPSGPSASEPHGLVGYAPGEFGPPIPPQQTVPGPAGRTGEGPRRPRRLLLGSLAAGLMLALGAGTYGVVRVVADDEGGTSSGGDGTSTQRPAGNPGVSERADARKLPEGMVGDWEKDVGRKQKLTMTLRERSVGSVAMTVVGEGPGLHCEWENVLTEVKGDQAKFAAGKVAKAEPAGECDPEVAPAMRLDLRAKDTLRVRPLDDTSDAQDLLHRVE